MGKELSLKIQVPLVLLSALLVPLCFPPLGWWPLVMVVYPTLLIATVNTTTRKAFYLGLFHGMLGYGLALSWFWRIFSGAALIFFLTLAVFTAFTCLLINILSHQTTSTLLRVLFAAVLWTGIEFYRCELFYLRFPWITPGSAMGPTFLSPILGVYGASFLVILAAAAFTQRKTLWMACGLSIVVFGLGIFRPALVEPSRDKSIAVTAVQADLRGPQQYVDVTMTSQEDTPDLIVWPECAVPYDVRQKVGDIGTLKSLCANMDATLILGSQTDLPSSIKDYYNTALTVDQNGVIGEYYKMRPVHYFNDGIPGRNVKPIQTEFGLAGTPICFDCDFTEVVRKMSRNGAQFFAVPTYDAAYWSAKQHWQHALLFRLRAAENGRWLVSAAASGVSQIIDPHGNVHALLPPFEKDVLTGRIEACSNITFFVRFGWLFPWLTLIATIALVMVSATVHLRRQQARVQRPTS